jgi:hypothetical protein
MAEAADGEDESPQADANRVGPPKTSTKLIGAQGSVPI